MWLIPDEILIQKPVTRYVVYLLLIIRLIHTTGSFEIKWVGTTWLDWWRNEQFFTIASLSAYPVVVVHMIVKLITRGKGVHFRVTSKQTTTDDNDNDKFAEMYEFWWVPMMVPVTVVLFSNIMAIGLAMGKAIIYGRVWSAEKRQHAALGLLFNIWILVLLQPFALAILGHWSKKRGILFILLPLGFLITTMVYIDLHYLTIKFLPFMVI